SRGCHSDVAARSRCLLPWSESPGLLRVEHSINPGLLHPVLSSLLLVRDALNGSVGGYTAPQKWRRPVPQRRAPAGGSPSSPIGTMIRSQVSALSLAPLRRICSTIWRALAEGSLVSAVEGFEVSP